MRKFLLCKMLPFSLVFLSILFLSALPSLGYYQSKLTASDPDDYDMFGDSVAVDNGTVVVGAINASNESGQDSGAAYVYQHDGNGWVQVDKLIASDGFAGDSFGDSVAIEGDTIVVGSPNKDSSKGAAYVYQYDSNQWVQVAKLTAINHEWVRYFGCSVAIDGGTIVVGACRDNVYQGSAFIYQHDDLTDTWEQVAKLTDSNSSYGDQFGFSVDINGNTVVIGSVFDDDTGPDSGSAFVYQYDKFTDTWPEVAKLTDCDMAPQSYFGCSVAIDGDTIVVGAANKDDQGAVFVYQYDSNTSAWGKVAELIASDPSANDFFGYPVTIDGDTIVVGASKKDDQTGAVYVFRFDGSVWSYFTKLTAFDGFWGNNYGCSVAISVDTIVVGAAWYYGPGQYWTGSAYVYEVFSEIYWHGEQESVNFFKSGAGGAQLQYGYNIIRETEMEYVAGDQSTYMDLHRYEGVNEGVPVGYTCTGEGTVVGEPTLDYCNINTNYPYCVYKVRVIGTRKFVDINGSESEIPWDSYIYWRDYLSPPSWLFDDVLNGICTYYAPIILEVNP